MSCEGFGELSEVDNVCIKYAHLLKKHYHEVCSPKNCCQVCSAHPKSIIKYAHLINYYQDLCLKIRNGCSCSHCYGAGRKGLWTAAAASDGGNSSSSASRSVLPELRIINTCKSLRKIFNTKIIMVVKWYVHLCCEVSRKNWEKKVLLVFKVKRRNRHLHEQEKCDDFQYQEEWSESFWKNRKAVKVKVFNIIRRKYKKIYWLRKIFSVKNLFHDIFHYILLLIPPFLGGPLLPRFLSTAFHSHLMLSFYLKGNSYSYSSPCIKFDE